MKQLFKTIDSLFYSMFIVLLSTLIFIRYSNDISLSKTLAEGALFQIIFPALMLYLLIKMISGVVGLASCFQHKSYDVVEPLTSLSLYGASLYFITFLCNHADISHHIDLLWLLAAPVFLSVFYCFSINVDKANVASAVYCKGKSDE